MPTYYTRNHKLSIAMETAYKDGGAGAAFVDLPVFMEARPEATFEKLENPIYSGTGQRSKFYVGAGTFKLNVKGFIKGAAAAEIPVEMDRLFRTFNLYGSLKNGTSYGYTPSDTNIESSTIKVNLDGLQYTMSGSRGEQFTITLEEKKQAMFEGTITSLYAEPTVVAFTAPTFASSSVIPPVIQSMNLTVGGVDYCIQKLVLNLKNNLYEEGCLNAANRGINEIINTSREFGGTITMKRTTSNDVEYWTSLVGSTELAVASTGFGTSGGNRIGISFSAFQIEDIKPVEVGGQHYYDITFRINGSTSLTNEFALKFD